MPKFENKDFVHLHVHSEYSQFDGLARLKNLVHTARKMGFPALALTDHGNIGGIIKFIQECYVTKDKNDKPLDYPPIKALPGCEFYVSRNHEGKSKEFQPDLKKGNRHLILIAKNLEGYQNMCTLSQKSWIDGFYMNPRIDLPLIEKYSKGLICQSACPSSLINANLIYDRYDVAKEVCGVFKDIFKDDFFLEIMYHGLNVEYKIAPEILRLGKELGIKVIATNDSHYILKNQAKSQEILMCMSSSKCLSDPKHMSFIYDEFYLKSAEEMGKIFKDNPEVLYNTIEVAERVDIDNIKKNIFGGMRLPKFEIPEGYKDQFDYLEKLAWEGMKKKGWDKSQKHVDALKKELRDIRVAFDNNGYDFATYFLIVRDYVTYAKNKGIMVGGGRGSGYASILLHCIGICFGVDPVKYGLLWERFLGFDDLPFVKDSDFGFDDETSVIESSDIEESEEIMSE